VKLATRLNGLPCDLKAANEAVVAFNRRWEYRSDGTYHERVSQNDQTRIIATTKFLPNN
jgi:hypothetical protein